MSSEVSSFEDVPAHPGGGVTWYTAVGIVILLGLLASIVDWVVGAGVGLATGIAFVVGCVVLGGRVRLNHAVAGFVAAPVCFAAIVAATATAQLWGNQEFWVAFRVFWTYALIADAPYLFAGTATSCVLVALRLIFRRR